jgi:uncharacterized protein YjbJ (UPF0337 family)
MLNVEDIRGQWSIIRGKLKEHWGQLTDDDLQVAGGTIDQLIGRIQKKVGAERRVVDEFIEKAAKVAPTLQGVQNAAKEKAQEAVEGVRRSYEQVSHQVNQKLHAGYDAAGEMVRQKPVESALTTFMIGLFSGLVIAMILRGNDS